MLQNPLQLNSLEITVLFVYVLHAVRLQSQLNLWKTSTAW